jgi:hypothetical protein
MTAGIDTNGSDQREGTDNGALRASLSALLGTFGVERVTTHDRIVDVAGVVLAERGHCVEGVSLRYRELVVEAAPTAARLLAFDRDMVLEALERRLGESVDGLCIVSVNGRARRRVH